VDPAKMAAVINDALLQARRQANASRSTPPQRSTSTSADHQYRRQGQTNGGVYQLMCQRRDPIMEGGMQKTLWVDRWGVAIAINFRNWRRQAASTVIVSNDEVIGDPMRCGRMGSRREPVHSHMWCAAGDCSSFILGQMKMH